MINIWENGYTGQFTISNLRDTAIEDWRLSFKLDDEIGDIWDATIISHLDDKYEISCEEYNQNINVGGKVTFGYNVYSSDEHGSPYDFDLNEYINGNDFILVMGCCDENENILGVYFLSSVRCDSYNIYISSDGEEYILSDSISDVEYYEFKDNSLPKYVYIEGIAEGKTIKSDIVLFEESSNEINIINPDKDDDKLCDYLEYIYGCNLEKEDTDGDGLTDYYEVVYTLTDPTLWDTDLNGISDAYEDLDGDNLVNISEFDEGTFPYAQDTDRDGLNDYDEIYLYGTNPLVPDTDSDGLNDGDELLLNLDPLKPDSDDNGIIDGEEYILQHIEYQINELEKPLFSKVSIDIECKGLIEKCSYFENMYRLDEHSSNVVGLLSAPVEISVDNDFRNAQVSFVYDENELGDTKEENLAILWYDRVNDDYVLVDSVVDTDKKTVSFNATHFSMYLVVDKQIWLDCWRENIDYRSAGTVKHYDVVVAVDVSGSMRGSRINIAKKALTSFVDSLLPEDQAGIVSFSSGARVVMNLQDPYAFMTFDLFHSRISNLLASGGTNANAGILKSIEMIEEQPNDDVNEKIIIMICDGDVNVTNNTIARAISDGITINCINVASGDISAMKKIAHYTGGTYYCYYPISMTLK